MSTEHGTHENGCACDECNPYFTKWQDMARRTEKLKELAREKGHPIVVSIQKPKPKFAHRAKPIK